MTVTQLKNRLETLIEEGYGDMPCGVVDIIEDDDGGHTEWREIDGAWFEKAHKGWPYDFPDRVEFDKY